MSVYAVILCGGGGTRMGAAENKTLLMKKPRRDLAV